MMAHISIVCLFLFLLSFSPSIASARVRVAVVVDLGADERAPPVLQRQENNYISITKPVAALSLPSPVASPAYDVDEAAALTEPTAAADPISRMKSFAHSFYMAASKKVPQWLSQSAIPSHLDGIDFHFKVFERLVKAGERLYRWANKGAKPDAGFYYTDKPNNVNLGLDLKGKSLYELVVKEPFDALVSRAADMLKGDFCRTRSVCRGGDVQLFIPQGKFGTIKFIKDYEG